MRPLRRGFHLGSALVGLSALFGSMDPAIESTTRADEGTGKRYAATDLAGVDADFYLQGEYYGPKPSGPRVVENVGLQVIALGDGQFDAVEYPGGLPGIGWHGGEKFRLKGHREGKRLDLSGDGRRYVIEDSVARPADASGAGAGGSSSIIKVHRMSRTLGQAPPPGAIVLFDGHSTDRLVGASVTEDSRLKEGVSFKDAYKDYTLHLEFQLSYMPYGREQGRSNSGVYLQRRYEVQILDSFGLEGEKNECGGLYKFRRPDVNMCLPPLVWQTYDIDFRSPRFGSDGQKIENARVTVLQNGYPVQQSVELLDKTGNGRPESPEVLPIFLQSHSCPVRFRNMWLIDRSASSEGALAHSIGAGCPSASADPTVIGGDVPCGSSRGVDGWVVGPSAGGGGTRRPHHDYWIR